MPSNAPSNQVYLVPFSHMDLFWLGEREECLSRGNRVIAEAMRIARQDARFRFQLEDAVFVAHYLACHPERREELAELVRGGRIEVGPKWAGIYSNKPDGESLIRNITLGMQFSEETFGVTAPAHQLSDLRGFTPQFPQMLVKCGLRGTVFTRCGPRDLPLFRWRSPDGSEVLTWNALDSYAWARNLKLHESAEVAVEKGIAEQARKRLAQAFGNPILMHWGIDLVLPTDNLCLEVARLAELTGLDFRVATATDYFDALGSGEGLPVLAGEIPSSLPYGETINLHIYGHDVPSTTALLTAERFTAFASVLGFDQPPQSTLDEGWRLVLQAMDHNSGGQGIDGTARRKPELHQTAQRVAGEAIRGALHPIAESVGGYPEGEAQAVVVFNPLAWERTEAVEGHVTFYGNPEAFRAEAFEDPLLVDERGEPVAYQSWDHRGGVAREMRFVFVAERVPSLGYRTYYFLPRPRVAPPSCAEIGDTSVALGRFRVEVDPTTATFSVYDLEQDRPLARGIGLVAIEEREDNYLFRTATTGVTFEPSLLELRVIEEGPIRVRWQARLRLCETDFTMEFRLHDGLDRVDVDLDTHWTLRRNMRVVLRLPFVAAEHTLRYGVPFGDVVYPEQIPNTGPFGPNEMDREAWARMREVQHWLDISSPGNGVTLASNLRQIDLDPPSVDVVFIRSSATKHSQRVVDGKLEPLYRMPLGPVHVAASISPHGGDWRRAHSYRRGAELNTPLIPIVVADPSSPKRLPPSQSFLSLEPANLVVSALKREPDGSLLLRAYEATGQSTEAKLRLFQSPKSVRVASAAGAPGAEVWGALRVKACEIANWLLKV